MGEPRRSCDWGGSSIWKKVSFSVVVLCSCEICVLFLFQIHSPKEKIIATKTGNGWVVERKEHTSSQISALGSALLCILPSPRKGRQEAGEQTNLYHRDTNNISKEHTRCSKPKQTKGPKTNLL
jgi:hypothetical protein